MSATTTSSEKRPPSEAPSSPAEFVKPEKKHDHEDDGLSYLPSLAQVTWWLMASAAVTYMLIVEVPAWKDDMEFGFGII